MEYWRRCKLPPGYRFKPTSRELIGFLFDKLQGKPLTPNIFNDVDVLAYYPQQLYDGFLEYMENGYIHFFSERKFSKPDGKRERPIRSAERGAWKASGGAKGITIIGDDGVTITGLTRTLVFYNDKVDDETGKTEKAAEMTDYALHEFMIRDPKTGKIIDLALYQFYIKGGNKRKKVQWIDNNVATADAAVEHDDGQGQFSAPLAPPPQPEMAPLTVENEPADMDNAFYQCYVPAPSCSQPEMENEPAAMDDAFSQYYYGPSCSQPEMENEPAAMDDAFSQYCYGPSCSQPEMKNEPAAMDDAFSQYYYGPSCSQPEMAAQPCYGYSHAAPAAVDPSFLPPVNQNQDEGVYLDDAAYGGLTDGMPLEMTPPDAAAQFQLMMMPELVGQMGGAELIPWPPEQALQQYGGAGANAEDRAPPPAEPCVAEHRQEGVGSNSGDDAPPSETSADLENSVVIGNSSDDADKTLSFLIDGDPTCKEDLEFCALFTDE